MRERAELALGRPLAGPPDGPKVLTYVRGGASPAHALLDVAVELDAGAIVVGSSHRGRVLSVLAGSVTTGLMNGAPCPVAVAPRGYVADPGGLHRFGVGFVDTPEGRAALTVASGLARAAGGTVAVVSVLEPIEASPASVMPGWSVPLAAEATFEQRAQQTATTARRLLPEDLPSSFAVHAGDSATILSVASAELDLLICGSRGHGRVRSVILGSVSRELARSAACPLLVVPRPPTAHATTMSSNRAAGSPAGSAS